MVKVYNTKGAKTSTERQDFGRDVGRARNAEIMWRGPCRGGIGHSRIPGETSKGPSRWAPKEGKAFRRGRKEEGERGYKIHDFGMADTSEYFPVQSEGHQVQLILMGYGRNRNLDVVENMTAKRKFIT